MADEEKGGAVVPRPGQRIKIVRHEPETRNYSCLSTWGPEFAIGTEHIVDGVHGRDVHIVGYDIPCLLLSEIEVLP